jgi:serine-type D-Ala-D-Ala carboxypeptidase/endopeptidase (penicillin-binding protein 4)
LVVVVSTACSGAIAARVIPATMVPAAAHRGGLAGAHPRLPSIATLPAPPSAAAMPTTSLQATLDALLVKTSSCLLVTDAAGAPLYSHRADLAFTPASRQKLLAARAALDLLGGGYWFTTDVVTAAAPTDIVVGDVCLVGCGDPWGAGKAIRVLV